MGESNGNEGDKQRKSSRNVHMILIKFLAEYKITHDYEAG